MEPSYPKLLVLAAMTALYAVRAPFAWRSLRAKVTESRVGATEVVLLCLAKLVFVLPLVWALTPLLAFADYPTHPAVVTAGAPLLLLGVWLFYRSHADLGDYWSPTLQIKEQHRLVTQGVYRRVRHPMYLGCLVYSSGLLLSLPNWLTAPPFAAAMLLLVALRVPAEERMLTDTFGEEYAEYCDKTRRLWP